MDRAERKRGLSSRAAGGRSGGWLSESGGVGAEVEEVHTDQWSEGRRHCASSRPRFIGEDSNMPDSRPPHLYGDLAVLRLLLSRRAENTRPGARTDDHRLAVVIGGGGMRGSYTAGMLRALQRAGLREAIDEVYGASSGAFGAAAFLTGQAEDGAACYPEDLGAREFVDLRRLIRGSPVISMDYLIHDVLERRKPLDWQALCRVPVPLRVVCTDFADWRAYTLTATDPARWRAVVRASGTIPFLAGPPVRIDGRSWIDGSIAEPLAISRAVRGGATHVLALLCRGEDDLHPNPSAGFSVWGKILNWAVPGLGTLSQGSRRYRADLELIANIARTGSPAGPRLLAIAPTRSAGVTGMCSDAVILSNAVEIGGASVTTAIDYVIESDAHERDFRSDPACGGAIW